MKTSLLFKFYFNQQSPEQMLGALLEGYLYDSNELFHSPSILEGLEFEKKLTLKIFTHHRFLASEELLDCKVRKYAPKLLPIFYDHFLRTNWAELSDQSFDDFYDTIRIVISKNQQLIPYKYNKLLNFMIKKDWMTSYLTIDGTHQIIKDRIKRFNFSNTMEISFNSLIENYSDHKSNFYFLFKELDEEQRQQSALPKIDFSINLNQ